MTSTDTTGPAWAPELAATLRGPLVRPGDPGYDEARAVYNAMIDRKPAAIARVADVADVIACVRAARGNGLLLAVRGGGHNAAGLGVADGALVVDLSGLRSTTVDPVARTVRADGGCTWGDVDHATAAFGMATPSGIIGTTGVAGLTLGGGTGNLTRRFGLTIDNLLSADVVLADGSFVRASADEHPDLFWALRGGGGNFGVVTSFVFRCHEIGENGTVIAGPVFYDMDDLGEVMHGYRELLPTLPEEVNGWLGIAAVPPVPLFPEALWNRTVCMILWCYSGPHAMADEVLAPVREFGSPLLFGVDAMPYAVLQGVFDDLFPPGHQWYWRADFVREISDEAIEVHRRFGVRLPTGQSTMHLYPIDGAVARVGAEETAFAYRGGGWNGVIVGVDPDPANAELITNWTKEYYDALHPLTEGAAYVNFMMDEGADRVRASYRENFPRLQEVKRRYDPGNLFRVNQNIPPS
ncbi:FAD-binding oxidoreductase [Pseudonocardia sp. RS11V-5]|uniref:FAD-binding oxidoreductase n=1 Tax=Pseudonocardia terrae TaxID=2905831 RepID=UPI001E3F3FE4|nr:FAD-binding oxidoreductase [Pseudonocardia terrae]MCE3551676.1 FAD-binding oxidoreductase [Pseudonocardia terrae]